MTHTCSEHAARSALALALLRAARRRTGTSSHCVTSRHITPHRVRFSELPVAEQARRRIVSHRVISRHITPHRVRFSELPVAEQARRRIVSYRVILRHLACASPRCPSPNRHVVASCHMASYCVTSSLALLRGVRVAEPAARVARRATARAAAAAGGRDRSSVRHVASYHVTYTAAGGRDLSRVVVVSRTWGPRPCSRRRHGKRRRGARAARRGARGAKDVVVVAVRWCGA